MTTPMGCRLHLSLEKTWAPCRPGEAAPGGAPRVPGDPFDAGWQPGQVRPPSQLTTADPALVNPRRPEPRPRPVGPAPGTDTTPLVRDDIRLFTPEVVQLVSRGARARQGRRPPRSCRPPSPANTLLNTLAYNPPGDSRGLPFTPRPGPATTSTYRWPSRTASAWFRSVNMLTRSTPSRLPSSGPTSSLRPPYRLNQLPPLTAICTPR